MNKLLRYILITLFTFFLLYIILKNISKIFNNLEGFSVINKKNPGKYLTKSENYINNEFKKLKNIESRNWRRWKHIKGRNWWLKKRHYRHHNRVLRRYRNHQRRLNRQKNRIPRNRRKWRFRRWRKYRRREIPSLRRIRKKIRFLNKIKRQINGTNKEAIRRHKVYINSLQSKLEYKRIKLVYDYWNKNVKPVIESPNCYRKIMNNTDYNGKEMNIGDYIIYVENPNPNNLINKFKKKKLTLDEYNKIFYKILNQQKHYKNCDKIISEYSPNIYKIKSINNNNISLIDNNNNNKILNINPNQLNKIYYSNGLEMDDKRKFKFKTNNNSIYFYLITPSNKKKTINSANISNSAIVKINNI